MPDYSEKALHQRAAEFYERIAETDPGKWEDIEDITPQLRGFEHRIRGNDCHRASDLIEAVSFHLLAWGFFDRLIEMRQRLKRMTEAGDCEEPLDLEKKVANEGGLGLAYLFSGRPQDASVVLMRAHIDAKTEGGKFEPKSAARKRWRTVQGMWLGYLAWSEAYKGQIAEATVLFNEALDLAGKADDKVHGAMWRNELGWLSLDYYQDALDAYAHLSVSVAEFHKLNGSSEAKQNRIYFHPMWALGETDLGRAYALLGHPDEAADHFRQAIDKFRQVKHRRWGRGLMPGNVGSLLRERGFSAQANEIYEMVINNQREIGDLRGEQISYARLGNTHRDFGWRALLSSDSASFEIAESELQAAANCFDKSTFMAREGGDLKRVTRGLRRLGNVHRELSRLYRMRGKPKKRDDALSLASKYHLEAHRTAPEGLISDQMSSGKDDVWEEYYDWLEQTRLMLERQPSEPSYPAATGDFLKRVKTEIPIVFSPELLMGVVLLGAPGAYREPGQKTSSAKAAFKAATEFAKLEQEKIESSKAKVKDLCRQRELTYALATAHLGLALVEDGKNRKEHQVRAEELLRKQIAEHPSPGIIRDVSVLLLMMQDRFSKVEGKADETFIIDSALDILRLGIAGDSLIEGSSDQKLYDECRGLFSGESRRNTSSSGD